MLEFHFIIDLQISNFGKHCLIINVTLEAVLSFRCFSGVCVKDFARMCIGNRSLDLHLVIYIRRKLGSHRGFGPRRMDN